MFHRRMAGAPTATISHGGADTARLLLAADGLGFSVSVVTAPVGGPHRLFYKHHWEASYMLEGRALLEDEDTGKSWELGPGDMYIVGPNDRHLVTDLTPCRALGVFNPPVIGHENHDETGTYPPGGPVPPGKPKMWVSTPKSLCAAGWEKTSVTGTATLLRYLLDDDGLGFTWSDVMIHAGVENRLWYRHHWEANYVIAGSGTVTHEKTGEQVVLEPGTLYCVGPDDPHVLATQGGLHMASLFNPPLDGTELHDADGSYPPTGPLPPAPRA
jgi:L-ectoine synthase